MLELSNICHCVQHPRKLTNRHFWSCKKESKPLSMQKYVLWKCCGVSLKWWMQELSNLCHCVQHSWKLTSRDDCKLSHSLCRNILWENAVGFLRIQWMLELSNLCHCDQHPWELTSRDDCSSRNERKPLSTLKHVWENALKYLRNSKI